MKRLNLLFISLMTLEAAQQCGVYTNVLQTRTLNSEILVNKYQKAYIENSPSCYLNTSYVYSDNNGHGLICNNGMAQATGKYGANLNINYSFTVKDSNALPYPSNSTTDIIISDENTILKADEYNTISQNYKRFDFTWSPTGENPKVNTFKNILHTVTINNVDNKNLQIGEFSTAPYSYTTLTINGIPNNIEIYKLISQGSNIFTAQLNASNTIDINTLSITRGSEVTLKAKNVVIENLNQTNSRSGNSIIKIYADNIDIKNINLNRDAKLYIYPYSNDTNVTFHADTIQSSSSSTMFVSSGDYYTNTFSIPGTKDSSSIIALDDNQTINFYINGDFKPGNNPGINSYGNDGNFGPLNPNNFRIFINGDLDTGGGGTTFNALIYVEGKANLGSPTYIRGALSSGDTITIAQNSTFYYYTLNSIYGPCPTNNRVKIGSFNVVEPTFNSSIDPLDKNDSRNFIYTKIANKPFTIKVIKLKDDNETLENYTGVVKLELVNEENNASLLDKLVVFDNESSKDVNITYGSANKKLRFRVRYFDFNFPQSCTRLMKKVNATNLLDYSNDTKTCVRDLKNVSENTTYKLASCTSKLIIGTFNSWKDVNINNITNSTKTRVRSFMKCIFNHGKSVDSRDDFAIRPNNFSIKIDTPQPIKAGEEFNLTIEALDFNGNPTNNYNENLTIKGSISPTLEYNDSNATKGCITGTITPTTNLQFIDGKANITLKYSEIGDLNLLIKEIQGSEFAKIDADDTALNDRLIKQASTNIEFIPHHFAINSAYENFDNSDFTYISNDLNMSSLLEVNITAENLNNETTKNYNSVCYANNFEVNISYDPSTIPSSIKVIESKEENSNEQNTSIPEKIVTDFSKYYFNSGIANLKFHINFPKDYKNPVEEFNFTVTNITVSDKNTKGEENLNQKASFRYGRIEIPDGASFLKEIDIIAKYEYWKNGTWVTNKSHSKEFGNIKYYIPNDDLNLVPSNISNGEENLTFLTTHSLPYSVKVHYAIPSYLWYHPLAKQYKDPSTTNLDCLTHPCNNLDFLTESTGWGGIGKSGIKYSETNRTAEVNSTQNATKINKKGVVKINW